MQVALQNGELPSGVLRRYLELQSTWLGPLSQLRCDSKQTPHKQNSLSTDDFEGRICAAEVSESGCWQTPTFM